MLTLCRSLTLEDNIKTFIFTKSQWVRADSLYVDNVKDMIEPLNLNDDSKNKEMVVRLMTQT